MQFCQICVSCTTKQCCTILEVHCHSPLYLVVANISFSWLYLKRSRIKNKIIGRKNQVFYEVSKVQFDKNVPMITRIMLTRSDTLMMGEQIAAKRCYQSTKLQCHIPKNCNHDTDCSVDTKSLQV